MSEQPAADEKMGHIAKVGTHIGIVSLKLVLAADATESPDAKRLIDEALLELKAGMEILTEGSR